MSALRDEWAAAYDIQHGSEPRRSLAQNSLPEMLVRLEGLTGIKLGTAINSRLDRLSTLQLDWAIEASRRRGIALELLAKAPKAERAKDSLTIIEASKGKDPKMPLDLGVDEVAEAQTLVDEAERLVGAVGAALDIARKDLMAEVTSGEFVEKLRKTWADRVALQPTDAWTLGDFKAATAVADEVAQVIGSLYTAIQGDMGATSHEVKELRAAFRARPCPTAMPTIAAIRSARKQAQGETPRAKAEVAAQARKEEAEAEESRLAESYRTDEQRKAAAVAQSKTKSKT
jgi:hypothetical protein